MTVFCLNFLYLGRAPLNSELGRRPNKNQLDVFQRLRALLVVCGMDGASCPIVPGRSVELSASVFQIEKYLEASSELSQSYAQRKPEEFFNNKELFPTDKFPQLEPYKSLDASRLKLVGRGAWKMEEFLTGPFWLPFQEPRFLLHGEDDDKTVWPSFKTESRSENLKLAKLWDSQGLLQLHASPILLDHYSKVFNCFKNEIVDRQIGDRRIANSRERSVDGPSHFLPPGFLLCNLRIRPYTQTLMGSITDRRDFYHQAVVSDERARSNMLPFSFSLSELNGLEATSAYIEKLSKEKKGKRKRESVGDGFDEWQPTKATGKSAEAAVFPCFKSLFQGDHLGVEFALSAHEEALRQGGLLLPAQRLMGHSLFPLTQRFEGLIIDDYFAISVEDLRTQPLNSFAATALSKARAIYDRFEILGSKEKDVEFERTFKAAGAEVISHDGAVTRGISTVSAPWSKRLALSVLTLRCARLPALTSKVLSRLSGNWTSVLMYRRCFASIVDNLFKKAAEEERHKTNMLVPLSRSVAQELLMLAAFAPLISSNVACKICEDVFASDASLGLGAVVSTKLDPRTIETLWLGSDKKGCYSRLDSEHLACLLQQEKKCARLDLNLTLACVPTGHRRAPCCTSTSWSSLEDLGGFRVAWLTEASLLLLPLILALHITTISLNQDLLCGAFS